MSVSSSGRSASATTSILAIGREAIACLRCNRPGTLPLHLSRQEGISMHRRVVAAIVAALGLGALGASGATAAPVALGGTPMNVYVGELGQLQAFRAGTPAGIYYRPDSTTGDAGFFLAVRDGTPTVYGFAGNAGPHGTTDYTLGSQGAVTGSGTAGDPLRQVTVYRTAASNGLEVTQTTSYVNGSQFFTIT